MDLLQAARARGEAEAYASVGLTKEAFVGMAARGVGWLGRQAGLWGSKGWQLGMKGARPTIRTGQQFPGWWTRKGMLGKATTLGGVGATGMAVGGAHLMNKAHAAETGAQRFAIGPMRHPTQNQIYGVMR